MISDADTIITDCVNNVLNVHEITLPNGFCLLLYLDTLSWQRLANGGHQPRREA